MITLPTAAGATTEYEDFYESTLAAPVGASDTDIYPTTMPSSAVGFLVMDPLGTNPEIIYYNVKGGNYVRVPSNVDGEGRGVGNTTPRAYDAGTKIGMYSIAEFFEGLATGRFLRDGFLQSRHFSSGIDPNSWIGTGESWNYVGALGAKEYQYVVAGDKRTKYSDGMKVRMPRVTSVGTQCADLESTNSQYAWKTSPANVNFTTAMTLEAKVKLESYTGTLSGIVARRNGDIEGWSLGLDDQGRVEIGALRIASNYKIFVSVEAIPLDRWVHIACAYDIAAGTCSIYINGNLVPQSVVSAGTVAALVQPSTPMGIGSRFTNTPVAFFDGEVSDVRVWSTVRSQAQIRDNADKQLVGNEAGLVAYYKLDGNFNDSTANNNHLTGFGGAVATTVDSPINATEYGVITGRSFAAGNTTINVFTGMLSCAPAENLTGISYSAANNPVGFPADKSNWSIYTYSTAGYNAGASSTPKYLNYDIVLPKGKWNLGYQLQMQETLSGAGVINARFDLSRTQATTDTKSPWSVTGTAVNLNEYYPFFHKMYPVTIDSQTRFYLNGQPVGSSFTSFGVFSAATGWLVAECAYIGG